MLLTHLTENRFRPVFFKPYYDRLFQHDGRSRNDASTIYTFGKARYVSVRRVGQDLFRRSHLHDLTILHDRDTVTQFDRFIQVVRNKDNRSFQLLLQKE